MDIIKKFFSFNDDDTSVIGLCKFNDNYCKSVNAKQKTKENSRQEATLSEILRRTY